MIKIRLTSVMVDDQDKALRFYSDILGFQKKQDIPIGPFRWLTVVCPEEPELVELALEPNENPAAKVFQKAIFDQGIPLTAFAVDDIQVEYERMTAKGVKFRGQPSPAGPGPATALFEDTCGNLIQLFQA